MLIYFFSGIYFVSSTAKKVLNGYLTTSQVLVGCKGILKAPNGWCQQEARWTRHRWCHSQMTLLPQRLVRQGYEEWPAPAPTVRMETVGVITRRRCMYVTSPAATKCMARPHTCGHISGGTQGNGPSSAHGCFVTRDSPALMNSRCVCVDVSLIHQTCSLFCLL